VVLIVAIGITTFMIVGIIPKFAAIFKDILGSDQLPWLTRKVMGFSDFVIHQGWMIIVGIVAIVVTIKLIARTKKGLYVLDTIKLRIPIFGKLIMLTAVAHFARTLGTLLSSGVPILQAMNIVRDTVGNSVVARAVDRIHDSVKEGETMALPMEESGAFPLMAVSMVEVGEETGALPEMLNKVADTYETEVDVTVEALTSVLEPIMIVMLAVIVGTIVVAMFLPLIELIKQM
jgi:type IV pilus assembly protein PilC